MKKLILLIGIIFLPFAISYADECDTIFDQALDISKSAHSAADQEDYQLAERLFTQAASYYNIVVETKKCRCPKIAGVARSNKATCINNARTCKSNAAIKEKNKLGKQENDAKIQTQKNKELENQQSQEKQRKNYEKIFGSSQIISEEAFKKWSLSGETPDN